MVYTVKFLGEHWGQNDVIFKIGKFFRLLVHG